MAKSNLVTRRVVEGRRYDIYKNESGDLIKLDERIISGKPNGREIAKEYGVEKVTIVERDQIKKVFGMPVEEFMKYAVEIERE